jgi:hypothetical protein
MNTREHRVIDIERHDPRVSGDQAYARAFASFGRRPGRSFVKLVGFMGLICGMAAAQTAASWPTAVSGGMKATIAISFILAAVGLGLWVYDSVRKHPQAYANTFKLIGLLLVVGFVAHQVRKGMVNIVADGVAEGERRAHHDTWKGL